ncbi:hypothetical protein ACFFKE_22540 [Streptomyces mutabilis]|uniref:hypothetical protein n=1 Tax=Streptomyces mutabilis TaxID=67332 RepID=UPI001785D05E|nr:hypothetical protein [Streptomyces mutabilis]
MARATGAPARAAVPLYAVGAEHSLLAAQPCACTAVPCSDDLVQEIRPLRQVPPVARGTVHGRVLPEQSSDFHDCAYPTCTDSSAG